MTKLKSLVLCVASSLLTVVLMLGISHVNVKYESQLVVKGNTNLAKGDIGEFTAQVSKPSWFLYDTVYQWKVLHARGVVQYRSVSDNNILIPAGVEDDKMWVVTSAVNHYNYILWSDVVPLDVVVTPVTVGAPSPNPGPIPPGPTPNPGPTPTPVTDPLFVVAIFDNANPLTLTSDQLSVHNGSEDMVTSLKSMNVTWRNYDKASPGMSDPSWQAVINKLGTPCVVIVDGKGKGYYEGKLVSKTDIINHVNDVRSGK